MRTTLLFLLLLPACAVAPAPEPAAPAPELYRPRLYSQLRGRAGEPFGCLRQDDEAARLLLESWRDDGERMETGLPLPFAQPGELCRLDREHWLVSGFDPVRDTGHLLLVQLHAEPPGLELLLHREYPHFDPWRLGFARRQRVLYLQDRLTASFHAVPWPTVCRPLPDFADLSPPLGSASLYGMELLASYGMFATDAELIVYKDNPTGSRPYWEPRFSVHWSAVTGWQVEWYFISDDPDAWVIA